MKKQDKFFKLFSISLTYVWLVLFALVPILLVLIASFLKQGQNEFFDWHLTTHTYASLFNSLYLRIFINSFVIAGLTTLFCLLLGYPFAYFISQSKSAYKQLLLLFTIIPFWTSALIRSYAMMVILRAKGIVNLCLLSLGIIHQPLQILYTTPAVIIGLVYNLLPFMILPLYANMEKLDTRLIDAAHDLGAKRFRVFFRIILPLTTPGILAGVLLVFLPGMTMFYISDILGGAKSLLVGNLIQDQFIASRNWPMGAMFSIILTLIMGLLLVIYFRSSTESDRQSLV